MLVKVLVPGIAPTTNLTGARGPGPPANTLSSTSPLQSTESSMMAHTARRMPQLSKRCSQGLKEPGVGLPWTLGFGFASSIPSWSSSRSRSSERGDRKVAWGPGLGGERRGLVLLPEIIMLVSG